MSTVEVRYAHAAPVIRRQLVYAVEAWQTAKTQVAIARGRAEAVGLREALEILLDSDDFTDTPGVHEEDKLPFSALEATREWLAEDAVRLGFVAVCKVCGDALRQIEQPAGLFWTHRYGAQHQPEIEEAAS